MYRPTICSTEGNLNFHYILYSFGYIFLLNFLILFLRSSIKNVLCRNFLNLKIQTIFEPRGKKVKQITLSVAVIGAVFAVSFRFRFCQTWERILFFDILSNSCEEGVNSYSGDSSIEIFVRTRNLRNRIFFIKMGLMHFSVFFSHVWYCMKGWGWGGVQHSDAIHVTFRSSKTHLRGVSLLLRWRVVFMLGNFDFRKFSTCCFLHALYTV